jgi:hypothetical protein
VDQGIDMMNEQVQGQISYQVARKIRLSVNAGYQFNQFINSTQPGLNTPTFGVSMSYRPFETTTISLSASRSVSASSYFVNQVTETTGFNAGINQRLFRKLNLGLSGGYVNTGYKSSISIFGTSVSLASRDDNYSFFSASLSTTFLKRGTASLSYSRSQNSSSLGKFGYSSDQIGFQLGYSY